MGVVAGMNVDECCAICGKTESDALNAKWYGCDVCEMWYHCFVFEFVFDVVLLLYLDMFHMLTGRAGAVRLISTPWLPSGTT